MDTTYLIGCAVLLVTSVLVRALPITPRVAEDDERWFSDAPLDPRAVAFLRRGTYGVVLTVLAELHAGGAVDASRPGGARPVGPLPVDTFDDPLVRAVYAGVGWCTEPRIVALLPPVRRESGRIRPVLVERGLLVPVRRLVLAQALLGYAAGLAVAGVLESGRTLSTMVGTAGVLGLAAVAAVGPRRTVAGQRVLRAERRLLAGWVGAAGAHPGHLLAAMVAGYGRGGLALLCSRYFSVGALAAGPAVRGAAPVTTIAIRIPGPRRSREPADRPRYEAAPDGPAIMVRPATIARKVAA